MRIGIGYDVHAFAPERALILGGETIPHDRGLAGHSDADVLVHAIMDALLGAAALGDIGKHFPDTDPEYCGADSIKLLRRVAALLASNDFVVNNVDAVVIAQRPKLSPYIEQMRMNIARALRVSPGAVSVKATTTEHLGFEGREEGIAAQAVCTIKPII